MSREQAELIREGRCPRCTAAGRKHDLETREATERSGWRDTPVDLYCVVCGCGLPDYMRQRQIDESLRYGDLTPADHARLTQAARRQS